MMILMRQTDDDLDASNRWWSWCVHRYLDSQAHWKRLWSWSALYAKTRAFWRFNLGDC